VTLAQLPPAATPAIRQSHRLLLLGPSAPSSPPWLATAGPAPPPAARCRAPDTAGHRGCRTAARSCGRPGSASRRSAGCTDGHCRAWASRCNCGPCRSPNRARWRSPRAGGSSGRSRGVTALGLVARLQPAHQTGGYGQVGAASRFHRTPPPFGLAGDGLGASGDSRPQRPPRSAPWRFRSPSDELPSKGRAHEAGKQLLDRSLGAVTWPCRHGGKPATIGAS
jgi:hypothetical protein